MPSKIKRRLFKRYRRDIDNPNNLQWYERDWSINKDEWEKYKAKPGQVIPVLTKNGMVMNGCKNT